MLLLHIYYVKDPQRKLISIAIVLIFSQTNLTIMYLQKIEKKNISITIS